MDNNFLTHIVSLTDREQQQISHLLDQHLDWRNEQQFMKVFLIHHIGVLTTPAILIILMSMGTPPLALIGLFGAMIILSVFLGGRLDSYRNDRKIITADNKDEIEGLWEAFTNACEQVGHDPNQYYLCVLETSNPKLAFTYPLSFYPSVRVSQGLIKSLTKEEIESVLTHEMQHHEHYWSYLTTTSITVASLATVPLLYYLGFAALPVLLIGTGTIIGLKMIRALLGNYYERSADQAAVENDGGAFARGLLKMTSEGYYVQTTVGRSLHALTDPHPPLNKRIETAIGTSLPTEELDLPAQEPILVSLTSLLGFIIGYPLLMIGLLSLAAPQFSLQYAGIGALVLAGSNLLSRTITHLHEAQPSKFISHLSRDLGKNATITAIALAIGALTRGIPSTIDQFLATLGHGALSGVIGIIIVALGATLLVFTLSFRSKENTDWPELGKDAEEYYTVNPSLPQDPTPDPIESTVPQHLIENPEEITGDDVVIDEK